MKTLLFSTYVLIMSFVGYAQEQNPELTNRSVAKEGTYQIRLSSSKFEYVYTLETLEYFESQRKEQEDYLLVINHFVTVFLPSKEKIESRNFTPLTAVIYE